MNENHHWLCQQKKLHRPFVLATFSGKIMLVAALMLHALPLANIGTNIFVADVNVSKLSYEDASKTIENRFDQLQKTPITFEFNHQTYKIPLESLGAELNTYKTMENVYQAEYGDNFLETSLHFFSSFIKKTHVDPVFTLDEVQFENALHEAIPEFKDAKNAQIVYTDNGQFEVIPHENGWDAALNNPKKNFLNNLINFRTSTLQLNAEPVEATIKEPEAQKAATRAQIYVEEPFTFTFDNNGNPKEYLVRFNRDWIDFETPDEGGVFSHIKQDKLEQYLTEKIAPEINIENQNAILHALPEEGSDYASVEGIARNGQKLAINKTIENFYEAIKKDQQKTDLVVEKIKGKILNETNLDLGSLELIGNGRSDFAGSPAGRDYNVRKGLNEKVNNILLPPGGAYDFNKNLGPVTNSAGWKNSLAIFGGKDLRPVPGGGLCQVATTVYRAAVDTGLPIKERSNHSLYVHYYTPYGDGLDAAIYPGSKNLKFTNNTPNYILIQAYDQGTEGIVNIYGTPDGRQVELIGPFYPSGTYPEGQETIKEKISIQKNQIGWWQIIRDAEGNLLEEKQLTASYRSVPRSL